MLLDLVSASGTSIGSCSVLEGHTPPGCLHRAFSVFVIREDGAVLMHRRAQGKSRFAGLWTNTCCSHPGPGEDLLGSAAARLEEEMGLVGVSLVERGTFVYSAHDPVSGTVESEYDHVLVGMSDEDPTPDPAEVGEWEWVRPGQLAADLVEQPGRFTPWLAAVAALALGWPER